LTDNIFGTLSVFNHCVNVDAGVHAHLLKQTDQIFAACVSGKSELIFVCASCWLSSDRAERSVDVIQSKFKCRN
jgi:hypothetical protein